MSLLKSLSKTIILNEKSLEKFGNSLEIGFEFYKGNEEKRFEILTIAYQFKVPQLNKILDQWKII